jgi:osomolarity two-component system response regulator SSK1
MDIQLPVMSGIEATKEIRRLERVNHIGVFTDHEKPCAEDELGDLPFPSPVIIVALTASSRESDRNEALAAGCNDFLTKPVGAPWLERKAIEWGCMQALIYTSFERKKRRAETLRKALEDGIELPPEVHMLVEKKKKEAEEEEKEVSKSVGETSATSAEADKPPVLRNESEESVRTHTSEDTDEAQT